ncbi:SAM-dependent chlorinase/fluorinase [Halodesulfovibrio sp.]|jgi:S-adenosylmethionine hydrolase|uniref:SAM hydrolase/SAM-dependent halogenase family protein n=1 Tax=Halodesulfovibrio sp. TaxID=1912772 RepID=UPI0025FF76A8|nr:SAM-dependent chlorinase/fluorinase [Halodesulfovibrio sp.]MCT4628228.1 SAM-dependent chlorinase/fluorinase [Halodesulfovibrio sp.]
MAVSFFLLTDFGTTDPYVAQMKGVLATLAPHHPIFDITHTVSAHNITQAAFFLDSTIDHLPPYSITICVVDPGVGTTRDILCMVIGNRTILAPDNGCLSLLHARYKKAQVYRIKQNQLPLKYTAHSCTFHGRTLFSPLAADIANFITQQPSVREHVTPVPFSKNSTQDCKKENHTVEKTCSDFMLDSYMEKRGYALAENIICQRDSTAQEQDNTIHTHVLHIDTFGNVVLNLPIPKWHKRIERGGELTVSTQTKRALQYITAYAELKHNQIGIICGSQGYLEIACNMCSAAELLNLSLGDHVTIHLSTSPELN